MSDSEKKPETKTATKTGTKTKSKTETKTKSKTETKAETKTDSGPTKRSRTCCFLKMAAYLGFTLTFVMFAMHLMGWTKAIPWGFGGWSEENKVSVWKSC